MLPTDVRRLKLQTAEDFAHARAGIDIRQLIESALSSGVSYALSEAERAQMTNINTDLHPRDELEIPKLFD